jgi:hypothetical protein
MVIGLPLLAYLLLVLLFRRVEPAWRHAILSAAVVWGVFLTSMTEGLSFFHAVTPAWTAILWASVNLVCAACYVFLSPWRVPAVSARERLTLAPALFLGAVGMIAGTTGVTALVAPPNNWDSLDYHMSRVMYWIQYQSIAHYPTHILYQIARPPWAEWTILHFQILSGGDRFANLVQWLAMMGSIVGISLIAKQLGANGYSQILAAVIGSTIPMGILQASSTQNDYVQAFWLVCLVHFSLRLRDVAWLEKRFWLFSLGAGGGLGLALLTKPTAYICALPFLLWHTGASLRRFRWKGLWSVCLIVSLAGVLNLGLYQRNLDIFGSPLGPTDAECPTCQRINEAVTVSIIISNVLRNVAEHLGTPVKRVNQAIEDTVNKFHALIGADSSDSRSTWDGQRFGVTPLVFDENLSGNLLHLVFLLLTLSLTLRPTMHMCYPGLMGYVGCLIVAFILFCGVLKWQSNHPRLHLSLFVLWSPIIALVLAATFPKAVTNTAGLLLITLSCPYLLLNFERPLVGDRTIFNADRYALYFVRQPDAEAAYLRLAQSTQERMCSQIGLIRDNDVPEYALWVALKNRHSLVRIQQVEVGNQSSVLASREPFKAFEPCRIVYLHKTLIRIRDRQTLPGLLGQ